MNKDLYKTKMCLFVQKGGCRNVFCKYAHDQEELKPVVHYTTPTYENTCKGIEPFPEPHTQKIININDEHPADKVVTIHQGDLDLAKFAYNEALKENFKSIVIIK